MRRVVAVLAPKKAQEQNDMSTEWDVPTFGVPKKAEGVSIVSNFRKINELIKRNHWPISIIQDMFDHDNVTLYNILPWGRHFYKTMQMDLNISVDII